jgi:putative nucleotidyltransferase with HDIG domain
MKRILFVDDERQILDGLKRMLRSMRTEWEMSFAEGGEKALEALALNKFDVVVSDMRMPGIDGAELLRRVKDLSPQTVRIVLSGESTERSILDTVGVAHRFLSKPCDPNALKDTINRACSLNAYVHNEALTRVISQTKSLPSPPNLYLEIVEELQHPDASSRRIGEIIGKDVGMSAKVLQLVNSAFFGLPRESTSTEQAVNYLGVETIRHLVLCAHAFSKIDVASYERFRVDLLWKHSILIGALTKAIVLAENKTGLADEAMTAGLLHDIGKLLLLNSFPDQYAKVQRLTEKNRIPNWAAERQIIGTSHAEVGAYLLGLWGIPSPVVEAVAFHHEPSRSGWQEFNTLTAVHCANALLHELDEHWSDHPAAGHDEEYLRNVGVLQKLDSWRDLVQRKAAEENYDASENTLC